ncbi:MAG: hypothetical protein JWQ09_4148 [Segetibacter sp.]|nr:hypothetical protein [Segetibacter sp.]
MKIVKENSKVVPSKGDRLKWTPLKDAKVVPLSTELIKGKLLTSDDLDRTRQTNSNSNNVIVP